MQKTRDNNKENAVKIHQAFNVAVFRMLSIVLLSIIFVFPHIAVSQAAEKRSLPTDFSNAIIHVAKKSIPSVVHIEVTASQEQVRPALPFEDDPFFRYFFGVPNAPRKFDRDVKGVGTGIIIDAGGHILTNYHVAGGATKLDVLLSDGRKFEGKLIGGDPKTDLAVIRIAAKEQLPYVTFGDSDKAEVGEWVVAIGHPRGLTQTVTHGIISAKHRRGITDPSSYQDFIQTDAAINPGNSGGPLLNLNGEVIGINTVIVSSSGGFEGIGLSIPSNIATHIARTIISQGKVERGWLGIGTQDLTPELAKQLGIQTPKGAYVVDVAKGGPAERAGMKKGDVIVEYQGKNIPDSNTVRNEVSITAIGKEVRIVVIRDGKRQNITARIGSPQEATKILAGSVKNRLGIEVRALQQKEKGKFKSSANGVIVTKVEPNGPLAKVGFEAGDMILGVNGQAITGLDNFIELVAAMRPNQQISLLAVDHKTGRSGYVRAVTR
jgi:serine protease Do